MTKKINIQPRSFSHLKYFPGCAGNPFDRVLHSLERFERIPSLLMNVILIILALLGGLPYFVQHRTLPLMTGALALFFYLDYILISMLPATQHSFGSTKITTLMLALLRVPFAWLPTGWNMGFEIAGTLLVIYGFYIEPFWVDLHHENFASEKLSGNAPLRVLHIGDLHIERITRREKWIVNRIKDITPDLILFSGDVLNLSFLDDPKAQADALAFFSQLSAPLGVYGVTGSPAVDFPDFFSRLCRSTSLQWLDNESKIIKTSSGIINLLGMTCTHNPDIDKNTLLELLQSSELADQTVNILLYHSPDLSPNASRHGVDLQLSGHTHGGQVHIPILGAFYTGSLYGKLFEAGRYLVNDMTLYISRGLGLEGAIAPRVRFLCRPEMILWEFRNAN